MSSFQAINYCQGEGGKWWICLKRSICVCASHLRRRDCPTTGFVYACLSEDFFLRLKFTELRERRFDNVQQLNFKRICHGTYEIKLIVATSATRSGRRSHRRVHMPTKRFDFTLNGIPLMNFKQPSECSMVSWRKSQSETWILNDCYPCYNKTLSNHTLGTYYLWSANT